MINFTNIEVKFILKNKLQIREWVKAIVAAENKKTGTITYVFCNDNYLGEMNEKYLHHKTLTDIITFDYSEKDTIGGDICISIDRVGENANLYKTQFNSELGRVMAHGVLHLIGYNDKTKEEKAQMSLKEDFYITSFPNL